MALEAGINCITQAEDQLIASIADCPTFQTFVGEASAIAASAKIHVDELPDPPSDQETWNKAQWIALFPNCLITPPEDGVHASIISDTTGSKIEHYVDLAFELIFESYPGGDPSHEERRKFKNVVGKIAEEIKDRNGQFGFGFTALGPLENISQGHYSHVEAIGNTYRWRWGIERTRE